MIHNEEELLYPERICAYEADKSLKDSDYVTPQVNLQCVVLQVSSNLICEDFDRAVSATKFDKFHLFSNLFLAVIICY